MAKASAAAVPAPAPAVLRLECLSIAPSASGRVLLSCVDLELAPGACVALVGPSGAGKTSLLRTLNGQVAPRAGRILVDGQDLGAAQGRALRALRSRIGLIAQKHDLVEPLAVHANVMAGALGRWSNLRALRYLLRARPAELDEARRALAAVGLADKLRAPTGELSGGEQQRVAIARALIQAPRLLLADEPVASLDPGAAREVLDLLTSLAKRRGMALICSLHQPDLAASWFDQVLELRDGRLRAVVPTEGHRA